MYLQFLFLITLCSVVPMVLSKQCSARIVMMDNTAMPQVFLSPSLWYSALTADTEQSKRPKLLYSYNHALHGFSAVLTQSELESVRSSKGILFSIKDRSVMLYTTRSAHFLGLDYGYGAWPASNYGEGVIIGIVDSGIWPESPSFGDEGMPRVPSRWKGACENGTNFNSSMCNKKLIGARYFSKGLYAGDSNVTITMNSTRDTKGHGTHVSCIAAGNYVDGASFYGYASGTARGMAPRAALAMYKPFFDNGAGCYSDVLAALDQAIADGVDVLSLSIGPQLPSFEHDPLTIATFTAMEKGIFVSMAAGNEGSDIKTLRNDIPWATIVGAGTVDREFWGTLVLGNGVSIQGYSLYTGKAIYQQVPVVFSEQCDSALENQSMIIVCKKPFLSNYQAISYLEAGGAIVGQVYITNDFTYMDPINFQTAVLFVTPENGQILLEYMNKTTHPTASMYFHETCVGSKPAPMVPEFSSRGPSTLFPSVLKPDVIAPGVNILGSWIPFTTEKGHTTVNNTGFLIDSGTSMASPHVAGVAALLKKAHPDWSPAAIRSAIMTSADILDNTFSPIKEIIDKNSLQAATPFAIGAGHINPNRALDPGLIYDIGRDDYINLLCAMNWTDNQIKAIVRSSSFNCSRPSLDLNYPSFVAYFGNNSTTNSSSVTTRVFDRKVKNVGEKSSRYYAKLTPIEGFNLTVQPEYLEFKDQAQELTFRLTIQGPKAMKESVLTGYLTWANMNGKQTVRSPIVVTTYD